MTIRLVVADDHLGVSRGLESALETTEIEIVGTATNGLEAIDLVVDLKPDILILDVSMPQRDGLYAAEKLREQAPATRVLMFSMYDNPTYIARSVAWGAKDYLLKNVPVSFLIKTIRRIAGDDDPVASPVFEKIKLAMQDRPTERDRSSPLTNRELQVLKHVAFGLSNREIGTSLTISVETVKEHVQNILRKVDVSDRTQAAVWAVRNQVV